MVKKIFISTNKDIGVQCKEWALKNLPDGFEIVDDMDDCNIFISVLYDKILKKDFLKTRRCYNFHPAELPKYGGVGTITWSLLNNESYHGVTLHLIDEGVDTGDIIDITRLKIENEDTAYSLHKKVMSQLFVFFKEKFISILNENYVIKKQNKSDRKIYSYKQLDEVLDLTRYMRSTFFPGKDGPYFYNKSGKKIKLSYEEVL
tara:strand:- start:510 stop:1118 length:609 start_codon:yes stop_codon:yes gene_type:complete